MRMWAKDEGVSTEDRSLLVPSLVYLGATILIGLPAMGAAQTVLTYFSGVILDIAGIEQLPPPGASSLMALSVLIGLQIAVEVAAIQLGGIEALGRGSPRVALVRYGLLLLFVFIGLTAVTTAGISAVVGGFGWVVIVLGLLVGCAGFVVLVRSTRAFITGFRRKARAQQPSD